MAVRSEKNMPEINTININIWVDMEFEMKIMR